MSKAEPELCTLLVKDLYGEFHSRTFSVLVNYGRLQVPQIGQRAHLTARSVRSSIAVLLQANLVHYISGANGTSLYEANCQQAYRLARVGRIADLVESKHGVYAARVMQHLLCHGSTKMADLTDQILEDQTLFDEQSAKATVHANFPNGFTEDIPNNSTVTGPRHAQREGYRQRSVSDLERAILRLANDRLIRQMKVVQGESEQETNPKSQDTIRSGVDELWRTNTIDSIENDRGDQSKADDNSIKGGTKLKKSVKRKADEAVDRQNLPASKRAKVIESISNREPVMLLDRLSPDVVSQGNIVSGPAPASQSLCFMILQANHERLTLLLRDQAIESLAEVTVAERTAEVYGAILDHVQKEKDCGRGSHQAHRAKINTKILAEDVVSKAKSGTFNNDDHPNSPQVNGHHPMDDCNGTVTKADRFNGEGMESRIGQSVSADRRSVNGCVNGFVLETGGPQYRSNKDDSPNRKEDPVDDLTHQLAILTESSPHFLEKHHVGNRYEWVVPFDSLTRTLRNEEILRLITARFGRTATRLVRLLIEKGKTDERILQELALITTRDMRQILGQLKQAGFIELQEIAREAQRNPSRDLFFWFYDEERVRKLVLGRSLAAMTKCLRRLDFEREKSNSILTKAARLDVRGREEMYLEDHELRKFQRWQKKEERYLGELGRLDHLVSVLRDF